MLTESTSILAFGFVSPAFMVAGAALVSIPIIIHILNRRRFRTIQWAAMEFLLQALRKNRRRLRFEQWLLLAIRCCVLGLLGLALARPMGCNESPLSAVAGQRSGLHVMVIDNSYSMAYEADRPDAKTHLDQAKFMAKALIDRFSAGGESIAIVTAARPATAVIARPSYDLDGAKASIDRIQQSYSGTDLLGALQLAADIGHEESHQPARNLYLFTDSTRSAWAGPKAEALASIGKDLGGIYHVTHFNLARVGQWNHAVLSIEPGDSLVRSQFDTSFRAVVRGFNGSGEALLQWKIDDQALPGTGPIRPELNTPPQIQSQASFKQGGLKVVTTTLVSDNRLKIDDTRWRIVDVTNELKTLIVEGERGLGPLDGSAAFLQFALAPPSEDGAHILSGQVRTNSYVIPEVISDLELGNKVLGDYRAVILTSVAQLTPQQADQLKAFVQQGGALLIFMGDPVNAEAYNQVLLPRGLMPGPLTRRMNAAGREPDHFSFDFHPDGLLHPLLKSFEKLQNTGLDTAQILNYWQVDLPADSKVERVMDYLPDEKGHRDPAITVHSLGEGRVAFFSTTAGPSSGGNDWNTLPPHYAYVALMHELLAGNVSSGDRWMNKTIGQTLEIPPYVQLTGMPSLKDPQQADVVLEQAQTQDGRSVYRSRGLEKPGVYTLSTGNRTIPIAVNVPAEEEADIRAIDAAAIKQSLGGIDINLLDDQLPPREQTLQPASDFGWSVMTAVLVLVAMECFLAMRFGHYKR
jgi:hypothetical protein